jgi:outer membrane protein
MKKLLVAAAFAFLLISCDKTETKKEGASETATGDFKTAYVDTSKLVDENLEAKDIKAKYDAIIKAKGKQMDAEIAQFQNEAQNFEKNAQAYGMQWAQAKGPELQQRRDNLARKEQLIMRETQEAAAVEMDTLVTRIKKYIKAYGKEKGFNYIYGTGEVASILYAKDEYDVTAEIIKILNDEYKAKTSEKPATEATDPKKK